MTSVSEKVTAVTPESALEPPLKRSRHLTTTTNVVATARTTLPAAAPDQKSFLLSPSDSIRTRLFQLRSSESDWTEVLALSDAIAAQRRKIDRCQLVLDSGAETSNNKGLQDCIETLRRELDDWTWPSRLMDNPRLAWDKLSNRRGAKEHLLQDPNRCREAAYIMLHRTTEYPRCVEILQACFDKSYNDKALYVLFSTPLLPTPDILQDRGLVIQILQRCPAFLRQPHIPPESFTDREFFRATVQGILRTSSGGPATPTHFLTEEERYEAAAQSIQQSSSDADLSPSSGADVLGLFSESLRNDPELALLALRSLRHLRRSPHELSFVGMELCRTNADFAVCEAEQLAIPQTRPATRAYGPFPAPFDDSLPRPTPPLHNLHPSQISRDKKKRLSRTPRRRAAPRRLFDLSDLSEPLRNDPSVLTAFCRLDAANLVLAPQNWQRDAGVRDMAGAAVPGSLRIGILGAVRRPPLEGH